MPESTKPVQAATLIPIEIIRNAPGFFSVLTLILRASGFAVVVLGKKGQSTHCGPELARMEIPFSSAAVAAGPPGRRKTAESLAQDYHPVVWIDTDFAGFTDSPGATGIVTVNWANVAAHYGKGARRNVLGLA